uniref:Putative secreted protein n=1 Tax=Ixodes ricinus TaxID=34613 RepID=A0A6B0UKR7_IXORI
MLIFITFTSVTSIHFFSIFIRSLSTVFATIVHIPTKNGTRGFVKPRRRDGRNKPLKRDVWSPCFRAVCTLAPNTLLEKSGHSPRIHQKGQQRKNTRDSGTANIFTSATPSTAH